MQNKFPGVNPHLNSFLQQPDGGWESFHALYIARLNEYLDDNLPAGYLAMAEKSLQVRVAGDEPHSIRTRPDVTLYRQSRSTSGSASPLLADEPTAVMPVADTLDDDEYLTRVVIHRIGDNRVGQAVTGIEILSPANKQGIELEKYRAKRQQFLESGLRLVEIDFLHESPPFLSVVPSYPEREDNATPYLIVVSDPRPSVRIGQTQFFGFGVLDKIPAVRVPLDGEDSLIVDFGAVYGQLFERWRFTEVAVDYTQNPVQFARYQADDQAKIRTFLQEMTGKPE